MVSHEMLKLNLVSGLKYRNGLSILPKIEFICLSECIWV